MITVRLPHLEPWQRDVLDEYIKSPKDRWVIIKSCRQNGKSACAAILLIYASFTEKESVSICVSPIAAQARKMFSDVEKIARPLIEKANGSTLEIRFINGSTILFKGAESGDSLRGYTVKRGGVLVVDEGAFIQDDVFYEILVPTCNVGHNDIFIFSTPKFRRGFFYSLYEQGFGVDSKIKSYDWTTYDLSKYLTPELLDMYRKQLPKAAFRAEFEGKFLDDNGMVFSGFKECVGEVCLNPTLPVYIGCDWATNTGGDYTVFTIGQFNGEKIVIERQIAFNDCNTTETIDRAVNVVKDLAERGFKDINIIAEKNSLGQVYYSLLVEKVDDFQEAYNDRVAFNREIEVNCQTFVTTNKSKETIIKQLINCFERQLIVIPNDSELLFQLGVYECRANANGIATYNAPHPYNDDRTVSLAFLMRPLYPELG